MASSRKLTFNINHYNETIIGNTYQVPLMRYLKEKSLKKKNPVWENMCKDGVNENENIYDYSSNDKNSRIKNIIDEIFFLDNKYEMARFFQKHPYSYTPNSVLVPTRESIKQIKTEKDKTYFLKSGEYSVYGNKASYDKSQGHSGKGVFVIQDRNNKWMVSKMKQRNKYVLQDGVENMMLNEGRKFDIRTHALFLKVGNRFKMYMWHNSYLRICVNEYNPNSLNEGDHLTNIHRQHFKEGFDYNKNQKLLSDLPEYEEINKNIKDACKELFYSLNTNLKINVDENPAMWIVGLDFIIDNNLKPWLIEVNHNPGYLGEQNMRKYTKINYNSMVDLADNILEKVLRNQMINDFKTGGWKHIDTMIIPDSYPPNRKFFKPEPLKNEE